MTLDGVIQSDPADGFEYSGWFFGYTDEACQAVIQERLGKEVDLLLGRKTFDIWEPYWPTHSHFWPNVMTATKYVASNTRTFSDWQPTVFLGYDIAEKVRELKQQDENECNVVKFNRRYATKIIYLTFRGQTSTAKFSRPLRGQNALYYFFPKSTARL